MGNYALKIYDKFTFQIICFFPYSADIIEWFQSKGFSASMMSEEGSEAINKKIRYDR